MDIQDEEVVEVIQETTGNLRAELVTGKIKDPKGLLHNMAAK